MSYTVTRTHCAPWHKGPVKEVLAEGVAGDRAIEIARQGRMLQDYPPDVTIINDETGAQVDMPVFRDEVKLP